MTAKRSLITDYFSQVGGTVKKCKPAHTSKVDEKPKVIPETKPRETKPPTKNPSLEFTSFNKQEWINSLTSEQKELLQLEIDTLHISWLSMLYKELTKPYFLNLKKFLQSQQKQGKTIFPKPQHIYSWSNLTPLPNVKCLILGQDPYHNHNQAHGLAFSVLEPTRPPPSLINIYKTLTIDYPDTFRVPDYQELLKQGKPGGGNLTKWATNGGVLMLNAVLTVEAHKANSHANQGWEQFTEQVIRVALEYHQKHKSGFVIMAWGTPAQKRLKPFEKMLTKNSTSGNGNDQFLVLKTVHPSPLSAHRGFFNSQVFKKCNDWLEKHNRDVIDWSVY
ncbi:Ung1 protein [Candida orthopsilosis Co 90-125]|uniref:Uracil-DNA glycosylase n=1 Tax=Candida orthopsilosis (strain 90-125) TaxID=1136231 RepID=H8X3Y9_CANO9|nr:Ung1 protein [Candida orthopsilosis Co 90-125]CCG25777.1 Ung1 protein [Candida orthopsilosis Co 90-125]